MGIESFNFPDAQNEKDTQITVEKVLVNGSYGYRVTGLRAIFHLFEIFSERPNHQPPFTRIFFRTKNSEGQENIYLITREGKISNRKENLRQGGIHFEKLSVETMFRNPLAWDTSFIYSMEGQRGQWNSSNVEEIVVMELNPGGRIRLNGIPTNEIENDFLQGFLPQV